MKGLSQWIPDAHSLAVDQMDLLTTVLHEVGHVLGYDDHSVHSPLTLITRTGQPGQVLTYAGATPQTSTIKADLGAALTYLATPFTSTLTPGLTDRLVFSVRPSEIASTNSGDVYIGAIIDDQSGSGLLPAIPTIEGLTLVASNSSGGSAFGLFRVEREGLYLLNVTDTSPLTPHPSRNYSVKLFIADDVNSDTKVDGLDGQLADCVDPMRAFSFSMGLIESRVIGLLVCCLDGNPQSRPESGREGWRCDCCDVNEVMRALP